MKNSGKFATYATPKKNSVPLSFEKDGIRYKMCSDCNAVVQKKKENNGKKRLTHTATHRTCYKCMRFLENSDFTLRATGTYFSACKNCNKYGFSHIRRAMVRNSEGSFTSKEFNELLAKFDACTICVSANGVTYLVGEKFRGPN